jgi:hypothetical protein
MNTTRRKWLKHLGASCLTIAAASAGVTLPREEKVLAEMFRPFKRCLVAYNVPDPVCFNLPVSHRPRVALAFRDTPISGGHETVLDTEHIRSLTVARDWSGEVLYDFPRELRERVLRGDLAEVNRTPLEVLRSIAARQNFRYNCNSVTFIPGKFGGRGSVVDVTKLFKS